MLGRSLLGTIESLEYAIDPDRKLLLARTDGAYVANVVEIPGTIRPVRICGTLQSSLFESIAKTGEQPDLAFQIADIFAWSLDFYTDPRQGDSFCLLVEKKEYGGRVRRPTRGFWRPHITTLARSMMRIYFRMRTASRGIIPPAASPCRHLFCGPRYGSRRG